MLVESVVPGALKPTNVDMPLAEKAQGALGTAVAHAGTAKVQLLHILWALTSDGESAVGKILHAHSITVDQVEAAMQKPGACVICS